VPHKNDTTLTGAAGEHLVLSRLLQRGIVAAQAPEGVRKVDILVNFLDGGAPCFIQVKARQGGARVGWHMGVKHESITDPDLYYAFVDFQPEQPRVHVIPSAVVAKVIRDGHQNWLDTPGAKGQPHNPTDFRRFELDAFGMPDGWHEQYLENWQQLVERGGTP
jgi:hypothetical protein